MSGHSRGDVRLEFSSMRVTRVIRAGWGASGLPDGRRTAAAWLERYTRLSGRVVPCQASACNQLFTCARSGGASVPAACFSRRILRM